MAVNGVQTTQLFDVKMIRWKIKISQPIRARGQSRKDGAAQVVDAETRRHSDIDKPTGATREAESGAVCRRDQSVANDPLQRACAYVAGQLQQWTLRPIFAMHCNR